MLKMFWKSFNIFEKFSERLFEKFLENEKIIEKNFWKKKNV